MTKTHSPSAKATTEALQEQALQALLRGEAVIFPTDTLFGIGVSVCHAQSPECLYRIKKRDERKPIAWLVNNPDALDEYGKDIPPYAYALVRAYWPGPLTLIVRANEKVPRTFQSESGSVGMRMPASDVACNLIAQIGCPLATTSANISGHANACSFEDLEPEILAQVPVALSDGEVKQGIASTVIDCTQGDTPIVLREGVIFQTDIAAVVAQSSMA